MDEDEAEQYGIPLSDSKLVPASEDDYSNDTKNESSSSGTSKNASADESGNDPGTRLRLKFQVTWKSIKIFKMETCPHQQQICY